MVGGYSLFTIRQPCIAIVFVALLARFVLARIAVVDSGAQGPSRERFISGYSGVVRSKRIAERVFPTGVTSIAVGCRALYAAFFMRQVL